ncbi:MAG: hypothetical protein LQ340_004762 [Diploschistes diacapsis]|nr:MAG: hypothetical protein LQ340_004762 [Diploschistes diacapsis]
MSKPITNEMLRTAFDEFFVNSATSETDREKLLAYLTATPHREPAVSYITEAEARIALATEFRTLIEQKRRGDGLFTTIFWAILFVAPLERLRQLYDSFKVDKGSGQMMLMMGMSRITIGLLKHFLNKPMSDSDYGLYEEPPVPKKRKTVTSDTASSASTSTSKEMSKGKKPEQVPDQPATYRSAKEADKARLRDNSQCIVTGSAIVDTCHIWPFASKNVKWTKRQTLLDALGAVYASEQLQQWVQKLSPEGEVIDRASNMLTLNPILHRLWGKALIGFEPLERIPNGITMRFWWLQRTGMRLSDRNIDITADPATLFHQSNEPGHISMVDFGTCRPICSGDVITVTAQEPADVPDFEILQLQWDLLRMTALTGAAEDAEDDEDDDDDDDDDEDRGLTPVLRDITSIMPTPNRPTPSTSPSRKEPGSSLSSRHSSPGKGITSPRRGENIPLRRHVQGQ